MYSFLVLGLVPGTNIQISFWAWIIIMAVLLVVAKRFKATIEQRIDAWWHQFDNPAGSRKPLHASQLHLRGL